MSIRIIISIRIRIITTIIIFYITIIIINISIGMRINNVIY
jgi:hypothetical protein